MTRACLTIPTSWYGVKGALRVTTSPWLNSSDTKTSGSNPANLGEYRRLFGDETVSYEAALQAYYAHGAPADWQSRSVSAYATAHPWEDFAETFAHYLHLVDTTEMAAAFGVRLRLRPSVDIGGELTARIDFNPYTSARIEDLIDNWVPLSSLINKGFIARITHEAGLVQWTVPGPAGPIPINTPAAE